MKVKINITGPDNSGKTTLTRLIADALASAGIPCEVNDGNSKEFLQWQTDRLASIRKENNLLVEIETCNKN